MRWIIGKAVIVYTVCKFSYSMDNEVSLCSIARGHTNTLSRYYTSGMQQHGHRDFKRSSE